MHTMNLDQALAAWQQLLGAEHVLDSAQSQLRYGADTSGNERSIAAALRISESTTRRELSRANEQIAALAKREPSLTRYLALRSSRGGAP